ncbi:mandelate racemase/muconate lactonizing enzyme family protein [Roseobacter ponti]|uniref:Mandelate racemase/muconate lactonizing enzyme family protein n=1 Tax=Roseobacter ponti TaxID=1891787 RepID=A0A858SY35_9RHOB|nr:mandelate racemase/muconate lactonizing enzyme family protein [Roseobacter ponti]QJF51776.1 mandelate racemase/muconate lactonizing enzyme family protein [Roseobacter ponti]
MRIDRIQVFVFRAPTPAPVATSFGTMRDRPAVFVRLTEAGGAHGWGEIFANWPAAGAEHRARLLAEDISALILGQAFSKPADLWRDLTRATHIRALQCGEPGPFAHVLAGIDTAVHDIAARMAGVSLARLLNPEAAVDVPVYASGIAIARADEETESARARGITCFKVKIGFDMAGDLTRLAALGAGLAPGERLFTDANQAWDPAQAKKFLTGAADLGIGWLEEPVAADRPASDWQTLAASADIPLAAGENISGDADFDAVIAAGALQFVQPDVAKWGGVGGCYGVARRALKAGLTYCPHFLGGGIGLAASAHLLAAAGGGGLLELDVNANPLRDAFFDGDPAEGGIWRLSSLPGLGIDALPEEIAPFQTLALDLS